jgi:bifunctional non-homologous end joining protein LigD
MSDKPAVLARLDRLGAGRRPLAASEVELMLAETRRRAFSAEGWLFELKYDGYRLLAAREGDRPRLLYRRGGDATTAFPEIAGAVRALPFESVLLDGELVVLDELGRPSFQRLQRRAQLRRPIDVERAESPATLYLFDCLALEGRDLRALPLVERKRALAEILPQGGALRFSDHVEASGRELWEEIERAGLEGMVAKRSDSPYRAGRSADWLKIRRHRTGDFAVVGFTAPKGGRAGLGALHLGVRDGRGLRYAGRVGSGFDDALLASLRQRLEAKRRSTPPCSGAVPKGAAHVWVEPEIVCEVRFTEWTRDGSLRQPVFLRLRDDKTVDDCAEEGAAAEAPPPRAAAGAAAGRAIRFTNLDKVFWPREGYTKGDLVDYYREISPWLLPYLRDRPLVLTRFPDGIEGKSFYQKDAPGFVPGWVRTERMWSEHAGREIEYFVCDDVDALLYVVNLGTIPLHLWSSRVAALDRPDWCILDLDPKGAPFRDVVTVARAIHRLCESIELDAFVKTSGATGLHVLIPLAGRCGYEESRSLAELLARVVNRELPEITTIVRKVSDRGGRVYLDYLQNRHGQTIAAPFSARPLPGAPVSAPLEWSEVGGKLDPGKFTLRTMPGRMRRLRRDPLAEIFRREPDLAAALGRLAARFEEPRDG